MPRANRDFSPIYTTEKVTASLDFTKGLSIFAPGETLVTATMSIILVAGFDATPSARLLVGPQISGAFVMALVGTYQPGAIYNIIATAVTSGGQTLTTNAHQTCQNIE